MAQRLLVFLKGRRVFGPQPAVGQKQYVVKSVNKISTFLDGESHFFGKDSVLGQNITALKEVCLQFCSNMTTVESDDVSSFNACLGKLKDRFGLHLEQIVTSYELDDNEIETLLGKGA